MTRDEVVSAALVLSFAAWVTAHVAIVAGLAGRAPRWRAAVALIVAPLAPWWSSKAAGMHARTTAWVLAGIAYAVSRWLASR